jgi:hypothetical protein
VFIVSLFISASRNVQRQIALLREEQRLMDAVAFHRCQERLTGSEHGPHYVLAHYELARLRRTHEERSVIRTGMPYWELHDLEQTARLVCDLERENSPKVGLVWERIPTDAIPRLYERVKALQHAEMVSRDRAEAARVETLTHGRPWWIDSPQTGVTRLGR